jgi:hypothetical protein
VAAVDSLGIPIGLLQPSVKPGCLGTLGPYEVQQFLGRGGMGIVLRALDPQLNRVVAVKVLAPELAVDVLSRRRFLREARAAAAVSHPHIVTIHAVAVDDDRLPYLVMECIVGRSLQQKIDQTGPLKVKEILRIGSQIAEGLAAAHKQGLVHRDIKPANILLENGVERVKITDFGLARSVDDAGITRTGEVSGTPQYMSPEQALGQHVDHRSDLFSLGCVLYAMCAGRPPFRGDNVAVVVKRICDDVPRPIAEINPEIPDWLIHTIERLLAKDPAHRFQSATEVADILAGQLAHAQQPQGGRAPPVPGPAPRPAFGERPEAGGRFGLPGAAPRSVLAESVLAERVAAYVPVSAGPAKPVSNWLLLTAFAVGGMLFGRFMPVFKFENLILLMLLAVGSAVFLFKRGVAAGSNKYRIAGWILAFAVATFVAIGIGIQIHDVYRGGDLLLLLGIGYLVYAIVVRRVIVRPAAAVAGTAEPPVGQPPMNAAEQMQVTAARPWKMAGWLVVTLLALALLIPCGLGVGLLVPWLSYRQAESEKGRLTIDFDNADYRGMQIRIHGVDPTGETVVAVNSRPFSFLMHPGQYTLTASKSIDEYSERQPVTATPIAFAIEKRKETRLNLH